MKTHNESQCQRKHEVARGNPLFNVTAVDAKLRVSARHHSTSTPQDLAARQDHEWLKDMVGPGRSFSSDLPCQQIERHEESRAETGLTKSL